MNSILSTKSLTNDIVNIIDISITSSNLSIEIFTSILEKYIELHKHKFHFQQNLLSFIETTIYTIPALKIEQLSDIISAWWTNSVIIETSNADKIKEISEAFPDLKISNGEDMPEVLGSMSEVILYKSFQKNKPGTIVEDTILSQYNTETNLYEEIVDIKWNIDQLVSGTLVKWFTSIAYHTGSHIFVFQGSIEGYIKIPKEVKGFAFDSYFIPTTNIYGETNVNFDQLSLYDLQQKGLKENFSARLMAFNNFLHFQPLDISDIKDIPNWTGEYQKGD